MSEKNKDQDLEQLLFDVLDEGPIVHVPYTFSSNVTREITRRRNRVNDIRFYLLITVIGIFGLAIAWLSLSMIDRESANGLLKVIVTYKWVWLIAISSVFALQYIDQRTINGLHQKH